MQYVLLILAFLKFIYKKIIWAGWRFYVFLGFWLVIYSAVMIETTHWINNSLRNQAVFSNEWWLMGISLLPGNAAFCLATVGFAYSLFWISIFKRVMSDKYKASLDSK